MEWRLSGKALALTLALSFGFASRAHAVEPAASEERYSLSWVRGEGAESCPARADLAPEVGKRLGRVPFDDAATRSIEIQIVRDAGGFMTLTHVRDTRGELLGRRELRSEEQTCDAIFAATALAVALLIDPEAALRSDADASRSVARFEVPAGPPAEPPPTHIESVAPPTTVATRERPPEAPAPAAVVSTPGSAGATLEAVVGAGLLPEVGPGASLLVSWRPVQPWVLAASALYLENSTAHDPASGAEFDVGLTAFGISGGWDLVSQRRARLLLEAGALAGALHASVRSPIPTNPGDFAIFALQAGARAELFVTRNAFVSLRATGVLNLIRRGLFVRGQEDPVFREPLLGGVFGVGLGLTFF